MAVAMTLLASVGARAADTTPPPPANTVWAWGANSNYQLGAGPYNSSRKSPLQVGLPFRVQAVAGGYRETLALAEDGTVWRWGFDCQTPQQVAGLANVTAIAAQRSMDSRMVLHADGTVSTWGDNTYGQLGDGTMTNRATPQKVAGLSGIVAISCGSAHMMALGSDGAVWAWGRNDYGKLGRRQYRQPVCARAGQRPHRRHRHCRRRGSLGGHSA